MITIIDYGAGNLRSLQNTLESLGACYEITDDPRVVAKASKVIFPGQGAAGQAMTTLREKGLDQAIRNLKVPFLGICLGMHLLYDFSTEGDVDCLGIIPGQQERFPEGKLKIPQMGWNRVKFASDSPLFASIPDESYFYFVHSYASLLGEEAIGVTFYGMPIGSIVQKGNFLGVQFHPEKSGAVGRQLLKNFIELEWEISEWDSSKSSAYPDSTSSAVIPAIDLMDGQCVRLKQGQFDQQTSYAQTPFLMAQLFKRMGYEWLHIIDLDGAKGGESKNMETIREIVKGTDLKIQMGGGLRSLEAIEAVLKSGVDRVLIGSLAATEPEVLREAIAQFGADRVVVAMDVREGEVRISGWQEGAGFSPEEFVEQMLKLGVGTILCTDISRDGMMQGIRVEFYEDLVKTFPQIEWIAAGGVQSKWDCQNLKLVGVEQAVIGKAFYEGSFLAKRVIPCLDIKEGRTVKGTSFTDLKDAGDPVELAMRYEKEGADELVFLDITATSDKRAMVADLASRVAKVISIPFTIGGGIRSIEDVKSALNAGADKVSIESAAVKNPDLISEASAYFGSQAIVISVSPKRVPGEARFELYIQGGRENTGVDLIEFLKDMQVRGAGEILLNSIDEDGQGQGYDLEMLRAASEVLNIPLIASSGAGELVHFYDGIASGLADAVLAASVFHYGTFSVGDVKSYLDSRRVPVRLFPNLIDDAS